MLIEDGARRMDEAAQDFLKAHQEVYGELHLKPKHHWSLDISQQWRQDRMGLDAFVIERQHLLIKAVAEKVDNTQTFERSVMSSAIVVQMQRARELRLGDDLRGQTSNLDGFPGVSVSRTMVLYGVIVAAADVIMRGSEAGTVVACARDPDGLFLFVSCMERLASPTREAGRFRRSERLDVWRTADIQFVLAWRDEPGDIVLVIAR